MTSGSGPNIAASVRRRLLNRARERGTDYNLVLLRYLNERLLYRLSQSSHRDAFILKGAMAFDLWIGTEHRPTRDIDLLGHGSNEPESMEGTFREILSTRVEPDGVEFDLDSIETQRMAVGEPYPGIRVRVDADLGGARIKLHIDVGFGDAVSPSPRLASFPTLLDFPAPEIRAYPPETIVAEKFEAMVDLGIANTRLKDFYDVWLLADTILFDGQALSTAVRTTFTRRGTRTPMEVPLALSDAFAMDTAKLQQWEAFVKRSGLEEVPPLASVIEALRAFLVPLISSGDADLGRWDPEAWAWS
jgi:predicted nucleotidyltransferase component of viral defense system